MNFNQFSYLLADVYTREKRIANEWIFLLCSACPLLYNSDAQLTFTARKYVVLLFLELSSSVAIATAQFPWNS